MSNKQIIFDKIIQDKQLNKNIHTYIIKREHLFNDQPSLLVERIVSPANLKQVRSKSQNHRIFKPPLGSERKMLSIQSYQPSRNNRQRVKNSKTQRKTSREHSTNNQKPSIKSFIIKKSTVPKEQQITKGYLSFVRALPSQSYVFTASFQSLRKRHRRRGLRRSERQAFQFIFNIYQCIEENLGHLKQYSRKLLMEYCHMFLNCFEKVKLEILFSLFYPAQLHPKMRPFLVYQRLVIFIISALAADSRFERTNRGQIESMKLMIIYLKQCYLTLFQPIQQQEEESVTRINQTFRLLKSVGQVEKKLQVIERQLFKINIKKDKILAEIFNSFTPLVLSNEEWQIEELVSIQMKLAWKLLKIPPVPYLPPNITGKEYTLVIELDNTLVYYDRQTKILKYRPYIDSFLHKVAQFYEIVVFSKADPKYVGVIMTQIQKNGRIFNYALSQQHMNFYEGRMIKDISRLGRNLKKVIVIDYTSTSYRKFNLNGIQLQSWWGDKTDKWLNTTLSTLLQIAQAKKDVQQYLKLAKLKDAEWKKQNQSQFQQQFPQ